MAREMSKEERERALIVSKENYSSISKFFGREDVKAQIARALPRHMSAERMARVALISISKTPKLLQCTPESLAKALTECSSYGLEPNGRDIHLVPFWNNKKSVMEVQVIPDYKGLVQLMYRSGLVMNVMAQAVRAKDEFEYQFGSGSFVKHKPADETDRGPLRYAWAMVALKGGGEPFVVLNNAQVAEHMKASKGAEYDDSPWKIHPDAMWAKTALRVLSKFVPLSAEIIDAFGRDDEANTFDGTAVMLPVDTDTPEPPKVSKTAKLAGRVENDAQNEQQELAPGEIEKDDEDVPGSKDAVQEFIDLAASCKTENDWNKLDNHYNGPESEIELTDDEREQVRTMIGEGKELAAKNAKAKKTTQRTLGQ